MQGVADLVDRHGLFVVELALVVEGARLQKAGYISGTG